MGYANHIGRVGALAVALGIGAAIATTPGIAYADGTEGPDPEKTNQDQGTGNDGPNPPNEAGNPPPVDPPKPQPSTGENSQLSELKERIRTAATPRHWRLRAVPIGQVLATGGADNKGNSDEEIEQQEQDPPPPPNGEYQNPLPPVGESNNPIDREQLPQAGQGSEKPKNKLLQLNPGNNLRTTLKATLPQGNQEGASQLRRSITPVDQNVQSFSSNTTTMTTFSTAQNQNARVMDATTTEETQPAPTLRSVVTGLLSLVGIGPSAGAGTPSFPFVPTPIFEFVFAAFRRIEQAVSQAVSNETPTAVVNSSQNAQGEVAGLIDGDDEDGDGLTYSVGTGPANGEVSLNSKTGVFTYTPDTPAPNGAAWQEDEFTVLVSDRTNPHLHLFSDSGHTYEVTVKIPGPQPTPPPPPPGSTTVTGQITGVYNPSGGSVSYVVQPQPGSPEQLQVTPTGTYTYTPTTPLAHGASVDLNNDGEPDNPVFQTFTVVATDQEGNRTTITVTLPVTPVNGDPEPLPPGQQTAPQPIQGGGYSGEIKIFDDPDGDPVKIVGAVASDGTPISFNGLNWTYGQQPSGAHASEPEGFAPFAAMMSFLSFDEGSARQSDAGFSTLAADGPVTITFTLSDGHGGVVPYTVTLPAAGQAAVDVSADGAPQGPAIIDASRDRAYQIGYVSSPDDNPQLGRYSGTTHVTVIDTNTGQAIGETIAMPGRAGRLGLPMPAVISGDTSHVVVKTEYYDSASDSYITYIATVDAETGELVDNDQGAVGNNKLIKLPGQASNNFNDGNLLVRGNRIYAKTQVFNPETGAVSNHLAIIDAENGQLVGSPITFTGAHTSDADTIVFGGNDRAYMVVHDFSDPSGEKSRIAVINTATGGLVGGVPVSVEGAPDGGFVVDDTTGRAYLTTRQVTPSGTTTWVAVVNTGTGQLVNTPVDIEGDGFGPVVLSKNGDRAYQVVQDGPNGDPDTNTTITVINTATGTVDGLPIVTNGLAGRLVLDRNANGNEHAYLTTHSSDFQHSKITVFDTQTRSVIDEVPITNGSSFISPVLSGNGKTVYHVLNGSDPNTGAPVTRIVVFDTVTGTAIGQPIEITGGQAGEAQEVADRLYVQTIEFDGGDPEDPADDRFVSRVAVINTETGQRLGSPVETEGNFAGDIIVNGDRAYQRTEDEQQQITRITVINTGTGLRVGTGPIEVDGLIADDVSESPFDLGAADFIIGDNNRAYQVTQFDNGDGTSTVRVAVINTASGVLLNAEPVLIDQIPNTKFFEVADDGNAYLTVQSRNTEFPTPNSIYKVTLVTIDAETGELGGSPLVKDGAGFLVHDQDGLPQYLLSLSYDFTSGFGGAKDVTFTPVGSRLGDAIVVPGSAVAYAVSPDGALAYVVTDGTDESTITVVDLVNGQVVATSSTVPGHAGLAFTPPFTVDGQGGLVFGADGKGYLTTWIKNQDGSYTTQVTGLPGLEPTSTLMSFGDMNVVFPDDEKDKSAPLQPEPTMVLTGSPNEFDANLTGPIAVLSV